MERFTGSCEPIALVDVSEMAAWIAAIPFCEWPQQYRVDEQLRPAMVTDLDWHGFGAKAWPLIRTLGLDKAYQLMLSVVMPGHSIPSHTDSQPPYWLYRVHVPLISNDYAWFDVEGKSFALKPGTAYKVNTLAMHGVRNLGATPRIHFMFDTRQ